MKIKKFLEQVAEEDRESLIDDKDIEFLASIGVDYNKKREEDKKKPKASYYLTAPSFNYKAFLISASCFIVVAIAVFLIVYYVLKPFEPPVGYLEGEGEAVSNLQELNDELDLFSLIVDEADYNLDITKTYDKSNGDSLYYTLDFTANIGFSKKFTLVVVVDSNYNYEEFSFSEEYEETQVHGYTLKYAENSKPAQGIFSSITCQGEMKIGEQWIYITNYNETNLQSTFIDTLESIISVK